MFHGHWVPFIMACAQNHRVLVDFTPESRDYGEMPLKAGEEVTVRYPIEEDGHRSPRTFDGLESMKREKNIKNLR